MSDELNVSVGDILAFPSIKNRQGECVYYKTAKVRRVTAKRAFCDNGKWIDLKNGYVVGSTPRSVFASIYTIAKRKVNAKYEAEQQAMIEANKPSEEELERLNLINQLVMDIEFGNHSLDTLKACEQVLEKSTK